MIFVLLLLLVIYYFIIISLLIFRVLLILGPSTNGSFRSYLLIGVFMQTIRSVKKNLPVVKASTTSACLLLILILVLIICLSLLLIFFVDVFFYELFVFAYWWWCVQSVVVRTYTLRMQYVQKFKFRSSSKALTVVEIKAVIFSPVVNNNNNNGRVLKNTP